MAKSRVDQYGIQLQKIISQLPLPDEQKNKWLDTLQNDGLNEVIAKEILEALPQVPKPEGEREARQLSKNLMLVTQNVRQWRLQEGLQNTRSQRR